MSCTLNESGIQPDTEKPVLHVVVIGFHHKKGCQVEYSYPPLVPGEEFNSHVTPPEWRNLPSLAVPDGAHNYVKDTIYFHLPAREGSHRTVYGVACYRQIDSNDLKRRTNDITRSTVQKSVCVLSYLPLYGLIQAKLELITHAYFQELDFSKVSLLEETYTNLNLSLTTSLLNGGSQVYLGMNIKDLVQQFRHKIVLIFKLILLERKILFTGSPVEDLGNGLLSVLSLFPGMIEHGLVESTCYGVHKHISPTLKNFESESMEEFLEIRFSDDKSPVSTESPKGRCRSQEPESPTIDRGDPRHEDAGTYNVQYDLHSETYNNDTYAHDPPGGTSDISAADALDYIEDHYSNETNTANSDNVRSHDVSHDQQQLRLADNSQMMDGVTQYEAVQAGKCIPKNSSVINIENMSETIEIEDDYFGDASERATVGSAPGELSISLESNTTDNKDIRGRMDSVEELDSPESITQIDREDCFSWEDDKLSLMIDTEKSSMKLDETAGLASSFKEVSLLERQNSRQKSDGSRGPSRQNSTQSEEASSSPTKTGNGQNIPATTPTTGASPGVKAAAIKNRLTNAFSGLNIKQKMKGKAGSRDNSEPASPVVEEKSLLPVLYQDELGLPLPVFTKGSVCFPYLSLQYIDLLNDVNVRSYVIGATNILFRQKRHLSDVIIDLNESKIEIHDRELQKQLTLTTADLRFADIMVKAATGSDDIYLDGTGGVDSGGLQLMKWEGNDEWLRAQFRVYIEAMLATVVTNDNKLLEDFGTLFIQTWKTTHNYRVWSSKEYPKLKEVQTGHPCQGNLGMADIKVRLSHTMHNTEGGKKINAAVTQTGKYVVQTGKVVGGALTQARSSLSSWFGSWKTADKAAGDVSGQGQENGPAES